MSINLIQPLDCLIALSFILIILPFIIDQIIFIIFTFTIYVTKPHLLIIKF